MQTAVHQTRTNALPDPRQVLFSIRNVIHPDDVLKRAHDLAIVIIGADDAALPELHARMQPIWQQCLLALATLRLSADYRDIGDRAFERIITV